MFFWFLIQLFSFNAQGAHKPPPPEVSLVDQLVQRALDSRGWKVDAEPQGKEIEEIQFETFPVFLPEEKALTWANKLHWTTKEITLRKELLLEEGDLWRDELAQETGRNLRKSLMVIFSKLVPCLGTQPGKIKVLVVSRDFWSLRFGYDLTRGFIKLCPKRSEA
jgi:hypothetical protein